MAEYVWEALDVRGTIAFSSYDLPQSKKFVTGVKIKVTSDSKRNDSPDTADIPDIGYTTT